MKLVHRSQISILCLVSFLAAMAWQGSAGAYTFTALHAFTQVTDDGSAPAGDLAPSGSILYGMARGDNGSYYGTILEINTDGADFAVVHDSVPSTDGSSPFDSLTLSTIIAMVLLGATLFLTISTVENGLDQLLQPLGWTTVRLSLW